MFTVYGIVVWSAYVVNRKLFIAFEHIFSCMHKAYDTQPYITKHIKVCCLVNYSISNLDLTFVFAVIKLCVSLESYSLSLTRILKYLNTKCFLLIGALAHSNCINNDININLNDQLKKCIKETCYLTQIGYNLQPEQHL